MCRIAILIQLWTMGFWLDILEFKSLLVEAHLATVHILRPKQCQSHVRRLIRLLVGRGE